MARASVTTWQQTLDIAEVIRAAGWFLPRRALLRSGFTDDSIRGALEAHLVFRVRQGWYSVPDAPQCAIEAVRIGGRLTGEAALSSYGIWTTPSHVADIAVRRNANEFRRPNRHRERFSRDEDTERYRIWWDDDPADHASPWRVSIRSAVLHLLRTSDRTTTIACIDSALNRGERGRSSGLHHSDLAAIFRRAPGRVQSWRDDIDGRSESGGETIVRLLCKDNGIPFEPQVEIPGVGRLDGRVGPRTYVEVDGAAWHDGESTFYSDRERDLIASIWGDRTLRLSYPLINDHPDWCLWAITRALESDPGLAARPPLRAS